MKTITQRSGAGLKTKRITRQKTAAKNVVTGTRQKLVPGKSLEQIRIEAIRRLGEIGIFI